MMKSKNWRYWFQFRLSTLFWISIAVAFTASISHRFGFLKGMNEQLARQRQGTTYCVAYPVKDLVLGPGMTKPDFDSLIEHISAEVSPGKWASNGGVGAMSGSDEAGVLVVYQDDNTHRQIEAKLAALRRLQRPSWLKVAVAWLNAQ
jgi:hypothetical protein